MFLFFFLCLFGFFNCLNIYLQANFYNSNANFNYSYPLQSPIDADKHISKYYPQKTTELINIYLIVTSYDL